MNKYLAVAAIAVGVGAAYIYLQPEMNAPQESGRGTALASVIIPDELSTNAQIGESLFTAKCAACHGANAGGLEGKAPPLIHKIYEPSHHGDEAFQRAVALGVQQHHWRFGNMPAVEDLTRGDVTMIVAYIREVQRANGIN